MGGSNADPQDHFETSFMGQCFPAEKRGGLKFMFFNMPVYLVLAKRVSLMCGHLGDMLNGRQNFGLGLRLGSVLALLIVIRCLSPSRLLPSWFFDQSSVVQMTGDLQFYS